MEDALVLTRRTNVKDYWKNKKYSMAGKPENYNMPIWRYTQNPTINRTISQAPTVFLTALLYLLKMDLQVCSDVTANV